MKALLLYSDVNDFRVVLLASDAERLRKQMSLGHPSFTRPMQPLSLYRRQIELQNILFIGSSFPREQRIVPIPLPFANGLVWHIANLVIMQFISRLTVTAAQQILGAFHVCLSAITPHWANEQLMQRNHNTSTFSSGYYCCETTC